MSDSPISLLWVATKSPWPPRDGGRLVQHLTLEALAREGCEITVVAPVEGEAREGDEPGEAGTGRAEIPPGVRFEAVACPGDRWAKALNLVRTLGRAVSGEPWTVVAHRRRRVAARVAELVEGRSFDVVHAEQLQAWAQTVPARQLGLPGVLRAQNVESDLWRGMAELEATGPLAAKAFRWQGRRLELWEGRTGSQANVVVALTGPDRKRLEVLARQAAGAAVPVSQVVEVPAPFPGHLPAGEQRFVGDPPVVLLGSGGWPPNRDAETWLVRDLWPAVRRELPGAVLHVVGGGGGRDRSGGDVGTFGGTVEGTIARHPAPLDSREAFAAGSVLVVPLRLASGVRMKILEAWARGIPVVATPEAHRGLNITPGRELLEMRDAESLVAALKELRPGGGTVERLVRSGRELLASVHSPDRVARGLLKLYRSAIQHRQAQPVRDRL